MSDQIIGIVPSSSRTSEMTHLHDQTLKHVPYFFVADWGHPATDAAPVE